MTSLGSSFLCMIIDMAFRYFTLAPWGLKQQKKCGADAFLNGGSGKALNSKALLHTRMDNSAERTERSYRMMSGCYP